MNSRVAADLTLGHALQARVPSHSVPGCARVAFLTGSTGFLGAHLLEELLARGDLDEIVCLVRASNDTQARARLLDTLTTRAPDCLGQVQRVHAVAGDISKPCFGLKDATFVWIADKAETIFHCAAQINLVYPYRLLRTTNVLGTYEVLTLAMLGTPKTLHYVSSLAVPNTSQSESAHSILETLRVPYNRSITPGYVESKWVAEQLVNSAGQGGLPVCIYRPGLITGHSRTGICNPRDVLSLMLRACLQLRVAPDSSERVHLTPADYVAQAIGELSRQAESVGKAFHLINPKYLSWHQIAEAMSAYGYIDRALPYREWLLCLRNHAITHTDPDLKVLAALVSGWPHSEHNDHPRFDDANTRKGLANAPYVRCPDDNIALLIRYLQWLKPDPAGAYFEPTPGQLTSGNDDYVSGDS